MGIDEDQLRNDIRLHGFQRKIHGFLAQKLQQDLCKYCAIVFDNWTDVKSWLRLTESGPFLRTSYHDTIAQVRQLSRFGCPVCSKVASYIELNPFGRSGKPDSSRHGLLSIDQRYKVEVESSILFRFISVTPAVSFYLCSETLVGRMGEMSYPFKSREAIYNLERSVHLLNKPGDGWLAASSDTRNAASVLWSNSYRRD
jgi:hypothetical protein